ncbi:MAG: hypothetical protein CME66_02865 [Halobacteriovoraceae bacterium]|nr:hypothetical protein [Halobacteriovoraceae bacterium]
MKWIRYSLFLIFMISASVAHSIEVDEKLQTEKIVYKPSHDIYHSFLNTVREFITALKNIFLVLKSH